ncbi:MAG: hypothetical protein ACKOET_20560 [Verrucomicrobiota bacterium]
MKTHSDPLDRLLRAARQAPARSVEAPGFALERGVLAAWRGGGSGILPTLAAGPLLTVWRWGLACACGVAIATVTISWMASQVPDADPYDLTNHTLIVAANTAWLP